MKNILLFLVLSLFLIGNVSAATGWSKNKPSGSSNPGQIDDSIGENNAALDLMLANYSSCKISYTSATTISVSAGGVMVSDVSGAIRLMLLNSSATSVTFTDIDTGAEAASTTYYVYAIGSATTDTVFTCKISLSASAPTGATYYKRLGSFYNDASSNIQRVVDDAIPTTMFGDWVAKSNNTTYLASTDGFAIGEALSGASEVDGFTDSSNPPTTRRTSNWTTNGTRGSITMPVRKGDYWKITGADQYVYWIPLELN